MSDIVEQLRSTREWVGFPAVPICIKAADEIERLRAENAMFSMGLQAIIDDITGAELSKARAAWARVVGKAKVPVAEQSWHK